MLRDALPGDLRVQGREAERRGGLHARGAVVFVVVELGDGAGVGGEGAVGEVDDFVPVAWVALREGFERGARGEGEGEGEEGKEGGEGGALHVDGCTSGKLQGLRLITCLVGSCRPCELSFDGASLCNSRGCGLPGYIYISDSILRTPHHPINST